MNQWSGMQNTEINLCTCDQMIFGKGANSFQQGKDTFKLCWKSWIFTCKIMKVGSYLKPSKGKKKKKTSDQNQKVEAKL